MSGVNPKARTKFSAYVTVIIALTAAGTKGQQIAKLTTDDATPGDFFGWSVSIEGGTAVVGARGDDDAGANSGSAYVFREIAGAWQEVAKLTADDAATGDSFGYSVSVDGDTAVVGAWFDDDAGSASGSAYVFREVDGVWQQIAKLTANDGANGDRLGVSVSLSGNTTVVGAYRDDDAAGDSGSAYVFREIAGVWQQIAKLTANDAGASDFFGTSVTLNGDTAVVGALQGDNDVGTDSGSAYVFREVGGVWHQIAELAADDGAAADFFGFSVSLSGNTAVIGALLDDDAGSDSGSAYVFREVVGVWQQIAKLAAVAGEANDMFGASISLSGDTAVVGANLNDDAGTDSGSAYVFREVTGVWQQTAMLIAGDATAFDEFGASVSIDGDTTVVGAFSDDAGNGSGSAYVFALNSPCLADLIDDGVLDFSDVLAFLTAFADKNPAADFADPQGIFDFSDVLAFLAAFAAGCP